MSSGHCSGVFSTCTATSPRLLAAYRGTFMRGRGTGLTAVEEGREEEAQRRRRGEEIPQTLESATKCTGGGGAEAHALGCPMHIWSPNDGVHKDGTRETSEESCSGMNGVNEASPTSGTPSDGTPAGVGGASEDTDEIPMQRSHDAVWCELPDSHASDRHTSANEGTCAAHNRPAGGCEREDSGIRGLAHRDSAGSVQTKDGISGQSDCGVDQLSPYTFMHGAAGVPPRADLSVGIMMEQLNDMLQEEIAPAEAMVFNPKSLKFTFWHNEPKLNAWFPDRIEFWRAEGRVIAWRNLVVSQLNLMVGFAVWLMWSIIVVRIQIAHDANPTKFSFGFPTDGSLDQSLYNSQLYLLPALAGLSGGTFRITNSFMILPVGGRVTITMTTVLLTLPCALTSWELSRDDAQLSTLAVAAMLSGIGGGAFASSMSNISYYFPGRTTGLALGLNGGIGNLGVSLTQIMIPLLIAGVATGSGSTEGQVWVGALFWIPFCIALALAAWLWLNDMPHHGNVSLLRRMGSYFIMEGAACAASAVASTIFFASSLSSPGQQLGQIFLMVFVATVLAHIFLYVLAPDQDLREKMRSQMVIFRSPHTYVMSWLYIVCFGTFIGFSSSFPKLIQDIFGYIKCPAGQGDGTGICQNPNAPQADIYAFLGPLLGALIRPFGGWLSDKFGGAVVTQIYIGIMTADAIGIGLVVHRANSADKPEEYFSLFLCLFLVLFTTSGMSNGSTFKQISQVFRAQGVGELVGPVLGWSSALASFGAFIVPSIVGVAIADNNVGNYMFGFAAYYLFCFFLNFWFYLRPGTGKCSMSSSAGCHSSIAGVSVGQYIDKVQQCEQCGGVKGRPRPRGLAQASMRPSLNHLDAEPCICAVIESFREETAGQAFVYQGKTWGAVGTATPLTERRKEKINGWLAAMHAPSIGRTGSASARSGWSGKASLKSYSSVQHMYDVMFPENEIDVSGRTARTQEELPYCQKQEVQSTKAMVDKHYDEDDVPAYKSPIDAQNGVCCGPRQMAVERPSEPTKAGDFDMAYDSYDLVHFLCDLDGSGAAGLAGHAQCSSGFGAHSEAAIGPLPVMGGGVLEEGLKRAH